MPRATLIYNPRAGPADLAKTIELVADLWRARRWNVSVRPTQRVRHAMELARKAAVAGDRLVLAAGGDGTLGEVANGLAGTRTVMAPLPVGTANSFAKELQMPLPNLFDRYRLLESAEALAAGKVQQIDLGHSCSHEDSERYWLLWTGTGADAYLVDQLEPRPKWSKKLGRLGYITESLMAAPGLPKMRATVDIDGHIFRDEFLLVLICNCRRYAGGELLLNPQARLDDGLLDVWLFRGAGVLRALHYFVRGKLRRLHAHPQVTVRAARRIVVRTEPAMPLQMDGERGGTSPLICEVKPGALYLLAPDTAPPGLFGEPGKDLLTLDDADR